MTATPTPEASAAPITENSAHTGPDHPAPDGPDRFDQGRKLVIASAQGAQDADEWVAEARDTGVTVMRLTDVIASSLEDCVDDPERKYEQMDSKARAAVDAGMGIVLDLSFIGDQGRTQSLPDRLRLGALRHVAAHASVPRRGHLRHQRACHLHLPARRASRGLGRRSQREGR